MDLAHAMLSTLRNGEEMEAILRRLICFPCKGHSSCATKAMLAVAADVAKLANVTRTELLAWSTPLGLDKHGLVNYEMRCEIRVPRTRVKP
jgi:hypothetical protein